MLKTLSKHSRSDAGKATCIRLAPILAHRIAAHLNAMSVVNQPVEDAVGQRRIADLFVPARDRQLRSEDRRAHLVAVLADLPEVAALGFRQRSHGPVIDHQDIDAAESGQQTAQATIGARHREIAEQRWARV